LTGYRLPTEAEWEYACRAEAATSRCYGETEGLLGKYGWYFQIAKERTWPVGSKKPNDLGLFDTLGTVWNWCQDSYKDYSSRARDGATIEDKEDVLNIGPTTGRVLRGGSFYNLASYARSANRDGYPPLIRYSGVGFRPVRTISP
jgi:formylglycine-generating enzyme required for sulfatase activity